MNNYIMGGNGTITTVINGECLMVPKTHPKYAELLELVKSNSPNSEEQFLKLVSFEESLNQVCEEISNGRCVVRNGQVMYDGEVIHSTLTARILSMLSEGFSVEPLLRFLENLMQNPSKQSVDELYDFLANTGLPITKDGCFLAYKGVTSDFKDKYSGTFDNSVGSKVAVRRNTVDDNRRNQCSYGLHVGAFGYAKSFAGGNGVVVLVKVNPKDVVSVPLDHSAQKCRTCSYEVVAVYNSLAELERSVYGDNGENLVDTSDEYDAEADYNEAVSYYMDFMYEDLCEMVQDVLDDSEVDIESMSKRDLAHFLAVEETGFNPVK